MFDLVILKIICCVWLYFTVCTVMFVFFWKEIYVSFRKTFPNMFFAMLLPGILVPIFILHALFVCAKTLLGFDSKYQNLSLLYKESLENISKMIILGRLPKKTRIERFSQLNKVFYNTAGYFDSIVFEIACPLYKRHEGREVSFSFQNKIWNIGYQCFMPGDANLIQTIIIYVYGGSTNNARLKDSVFPREISYYLFENVITIELLLPDLLQDEIQRKMSNDLHSLIHASINHFFMNIKNEPYRFFENSGIMVSDKVKYFLYGVSFGGRTALRHGQLYPKTFDGYIALNAADCGFKSFDMPILNRPRWFDNALTLSVLDNVQKSVDPILIMQNANDNNVNLRCALELFKAFEKAGNSHLVRLVVFEHGAAGGSSVDKGHGYPCDRSFFYDVIKAFIANGATRIPELHKARYLRHECKVRQYNRTNNFKKRFLALAHQRYEEDLHHRISFKNKENGSDWEGIWDQEYKSLLWTLKVIHKMAKHPAYGKETISSLNRDNLLTDEVITKSVENHFPQFKEYVEELNLFQNVSSISPDMLSVFREKLLNFVDVYSISCRIFLLENLYFSNPQLLPAFESSCAWTEKSFDRTSRKLKNRFEKQLTELSAAIIDVWKSAAQQALCHDRQYPGSSSIQCVPCSSSQSLISASSAP